MASGLKKPVKNEDGFEMLARLIKSESDDIRDEMHRGFAAVDERFEQVEKRFEVVDKRLENIETDIHSIRIELAYIHSRLDTLEESIAHTKGYSKEIDELRARVKVLENRINANSAR